MSPVVCIAAALLVTLFLLSCLLAKPFLCVEGGSRRADVIVILGGHLEHRVRRAAELFHAGAAPCVLVSDDDPPACVCQLLTAAGVPQDAIFVENQSRNTRENAEYSVRWLKQHDARRAIIVTSWFHSRRAVACFLHFGPEIEFSSLPTYHGPLVRRFGSRHELWGILREYPALLWYWARYGISPFPALAA
jgi:uncharacterized SAM-binding protein YcdF (DUF218 family)